AINSISSITRAVANPWRTATTPGIGRPARTLSHAYPINVSKSWVSSRRRSRAAHSNTSGSGAADRPTSGTRTRSRAGSRRRRARTTSPSKSWSDANRRIGRTPASQKARSDLGPRHPGLGLGLPLVAAGLPFGQVGFDLGAVAEVVAQDRVHVLQWQGVVAQHDLLGRRASVERAHHGVERHARPGDAKHTVGVGTHRWWLGH